MAFSAFEVSTKTMHISLCAPIKSEDEIQHILEFADKIYMTFGLSYRLELSTRPEKSKTIGTDEEWEIATNGLKRSSG